MKVATLLSLGAVALAAPTAEPRSKVPVNRKRHSVTRADGTVDMDAYLTTVKNTVLKYNKNAQLGSALLNAGTGLLKKRSGSNEPLVDDTEGEEDELYYGTGSIRGLDFTFDFDTGSSDLFVPGPSCTASDGCSGTVRYDNGGKDEGNTTTVLYGSGEVMGENYFDTVTIAGLTATHQNVVSLTQAQGFSGTGADALCGMAFESIANSEQPPFFFTLISEGKCSAQEFAFYLGREKSGTGPDSELTFCGRDSSKYSGAVTEVPLSSETYWQVPIGGASVGSGSVIPATDGQAAIDTGTTLVVAPVAAAELVMSQVVGAVPIPLGVGIVGYAYPCAESPVVKLEFANELFEINPLDFNFGSVTEDEGIDLGNSTLANELANGLCIAGIAGAELDPPVELWIVGDTFIKNWYSIFHYDSPSSAYVGFAKAVGNQ